MISLIRYPGSKAKLADAIWRLFPSEAQFELWSSSRPIEYREPFFGAGAIGFKVMPLLDSKCSVWLNDIDPAMVALWKTVKEHPEELIKRCNVFTPSAEWFYKFKDEDGRTDIPDEIAAFRKLALHRMSYSGLGARAGGPIGGKDQGNAKYDVSCRWNPEQIKLNVKRAHKLLTRFARVRITCGDFAPLITEPADNAFIYLDPPYYEKGSQLYKYAMEESDHARLADLLRSTSHRWLLSYDDHPQVRRLYDGCEFRELCVTYTMATATEATRPKNHEVVILPNRSAVAAA